MPTTDKDWFDALHGDLKSLNDKVQRIEVSLAEMTGKEYGQKLEKLSVKIEGLEAFRSRAIGALAIVALIWSPLCAIATGTLVWWITR